MFDWFRRWNWLREARKFKAPPAPARPPETHPDSMTTLTPEERVTWGEITKRLRP